jgi:tRNA(Ile)-lysidine synthase
MMNFEHQVWKCFKDSKLSLHNNFILCISGGLDSMVLLSVFAKVKPEANIKVLHYHHGMTNDAVLQKFRDDNLNFIKSKVDQLKLVNIDFHCEISEKKLMTEEQMRTARWAFIKSRQKSNEVIVTAHHLDDRFETMLLKMIRGTSADGFVSFKVWNQEIFRPFLNFSKSELMDYAQKQNIEWNFDPSNADESYLRNWIRENWLKQLDEKVNLGSKNMAKSFFKIADLVADSPTFELVVDENSDGLALSRRWYVSLSKAEQLRALSLYLKKHQIFSFTSGQLEEIRKRLDKNQKDITFELLARKWVINASQIMLQ